METEPPPARPCPHCRQPVAADRTVCPNCGADVPAVWPPPPDGVAAPPVPAPRLMTGARAGDIAAGIVTGIALPLLLATVLQLIPALRVLEFLLPAGSCIGLYLWARPRYPVFARSLGWALLAWVLLPLGIVALCFVVMSREH